jgi:hypothetical protein
MPADGRGVDPADVCLAAASEEGRVGVDDFLPVARTRHADPVVMLRDRRSSRLLAGELAPQVLDAVALPGSHVEEVI